MATTNRREFNRAILGSVGAAMVSSGPESSAYESAEVQEISGSITDVSGISVGHFTDKRRPTGCTVLLFGKDGAATGVDYDGSAPGTYQDRKSVV